MKRLPIIIIASGWFAFSLIFSLSHISTIFAAESADTKSAAVSSAPLDVELSRLINAHQINTIKTESNESPEKVKLGQFLFFDKVLSGSKDMACATCHHPNTHSGDDLAFQLV